MPPSCFNTHSEDIKRALEENLADSNQWNPNQHWVVECSEEYGLTLKMNNKKFPKISKYQ